MAALHLYLVATILLQIFGVYGLDYLIYGSKSIRPHSVYPITVLLRKATSDVNISLSLDADEKTILTKNATLIPDVSHKLFLQIEDLDAGSTIRLRARGVDISDFFDTVADVEIGQEETRKNSLKNFIFIQTDKPLYKAGDVVKFRVLTVDQRLLPVVLPLKVYIRDSQGNVIKQYLNATDPKVKGFFSGELPLSVQPVLGAWKIEAEYTKNARETKEFTVDEYVLPRFDVKIIAPKYVTPQDGDIVIFVEANYTFGEAVRGSVDLNIATPGRTSFRLWEAISSDDSIQHASSKIYHIPNFSGRANISVPVTAVLNATRKYSDSEKLQISANFTEALTGASRNATTIEIPISNVPYKLTIISSSKETFLPGFSYSFRGTILDLTNRPLPSSAKSVAVTYTFYDKRGDWGQSISPNTPATTIVEETTTSATRIIDAGFSVGWPRIPRTYRHLPRNELTENVKLSRDGSFSLDITSPKNARRMEVSAKYGEANGTITINGRISPSSSYIQVTPLNGDSHAGKTADFGINMTTHDDETLYYTVLSNSNSSYSLVDSVSDSGKYVEISVPVTEDIGTSGRLIIYYIRSDREVVGGTAPFTISRTFANNVVISASPDKRQHYAQPGEQATVKVQTTPLAFVGLLAMDESLLFLKAGNDIAFSDLNNALDSGKAVGDSDAFTVEDYFSKADLFLLTNDKVPSSAESRPTPVYSPQFATAFLPHFRVSGAHAGAAAQISSDSSDMDDSDEGMNYMIYPSTTSTWTGDTRRNSPQEPIKVRTDFRETYLFDTVFASESGTVELKSRVPDAITTWRITAFSLSESTGLGVSEHAARLKVFQPFFVVLNLPYSVIRGERLLVEVVVFNYMSQDQNVSVNLEKSQFKSSKQTNQNSTNVKSGESGIVTFSVTPQKIGDFNLKVTAQSAVASDVVEKKLPVKPEGVKQYYNRPVFIDLRTSSTFSTSVKLPSNPAGFVAGSDFVQVGVVGDILGPAMNNLDGLIRLPTGCGEQNMAFTAPNIVVMKYLQIANKMTKVQKDKLTANIRLGYQRELTYKHNDNSYSAWGQSDPKGSTWLTAYVARIFVKAGRFIDIDDQVIKTALRYLVDQQNSDGSFSENGIVVDKKYQGGAANGVPLTAFTLLPFLDYAENKTVPKKFAETRDKAVSFLESQLSSLDNDTYALAITTYALVLAKSVKAKEFLDELNAHAERNDTSTYWPTKTTSSDYTDDLTQFATNPKDIEATAYALMAFILADRAEEAFPAASWLLSKQSATGGFVSTQDTVVGLMALGEFARLSVTSPKIDLTVQSDSEKLTKVSVTPENALVLQKIELPKKPNTVKLEASGEGIALVHVSWNYNVSDLRMQVCARYLKDGRSSMAVVEVNALSGYHIDEDEVRKLVGSVAKMKKVEVENKETKLNFYFDEISQSATCWKIAMYRIFKVEQLKEQTVAVYDYYNPVDRKTVSYNIK